MPIAIALILRLLCPIAAVAADEGRGPEVRQFKVYLAGPLGFSDTGRLYQDQVLIPDLRRLGYDVINPWDLPDKQQISTILGMPSGPDRQQAWKRLDVGIGHTNAMMIDKSDAVLAVLDGPDVDSGTAAEIGYAAARGKPIVGLRTDFRLSSDNEGTVVNLQVEYFILASGGKIAKSLPEVEQNFGALTSTALSPTPIATELTPPRRLLVQASVSHPPSNEVGNIVKFYQSVFTVVLALALGESFKQFVSETKAETKNPNTPTDRTIHWNRLPALIVFLATIIPFFEGMNRYFDLKYQNLESLKLLYPNYLLRDGFAFLGESAIFFVIARSFSPIFIFRLLNCLIVLFSIDLVRDVTDLILPSHELGPWTIQNVMAMSALIIIRVILQIWKTKIEPPNGEFDRQLAVKFSCFLAFLAVIRTWWDYGSAWTFYFPDLT